jgi:hypothetical protein
MYEKDPKVFIFPWGPYEQNLIYGFFTMGR